MAGTKVLFLCLCDRLVLFHGFLLKASNFERRVNALPNQSPLLDGAVAPLWVWRGRSGGDGRRVVKRRVELGGEGGRGGVLQEGDVVVL